MNWRLNVLFYSCYCEKFLFSCINVPTDDKWFKKCYTNKVKVLGKEYDGVEIDPFKEYFKESEPDKQKKVYAWRTTISIFNRNSYSEY